MQVDEKLYPDELISFRHAPGYGGMDLTVKVNSGAESREVTLCLTKGDVIRLQGWIATVRKFDTGLDEA